MVSFCRVTQPGVQRYLDSSRHRQVNQVMNIPPWLKAMGDELGGPDAREKAPLAPKPFQAAMSSFSRRSRTGTCAAAEPKVFAPRPMTAP